MYIIDNLQLIKKKKESHPLHVKDLIPLCINQNQKVEFTGSLLERGMISKLRDGGGKSLGIVWKTPFMVNVTEALKQGEKKLGIRITNLWVNRLIGDQQPDVEVKTSYVSMPFYKVGSPLKPSGLIGPIQVLSLTKN